MYSPNSQYEWTDTNPLDRAPQSAPLPHANQQARAPSPPVAHTALVKSIELATEAVPCKSTMMMNIERPICVDTPEVRFRFRFRLLLDCFSFPCWVFSSVLFFFLHFACLLFFFSIP